MQSKSSSSFNLLPKFLVHYKLVPRIGIIPIYTCLFLAPLANAKIFSIRNTTINIHEINEFKCPMFPQHFLIFSVLPTHWSLSFHNSTRQPPLWYSSSSASPPNQWPRASSLPFLPTPFAKWSNICCYKSRWRRWVVNIWQI